MKGQKCWNFTYLHKTAIISHISPDFIAHCIHCCYRHMYINWIIISCSGKYFRPHFSSPLFCNTRDKTTLLLLEYTATSKFLMTGLALLLMPYRY